MFRNDKKIIVTILLFLLLTPLFVNAQAATNNQSLFGKGWGLVTDSSKTIYNGTKNFFTNFFDANGVDANDTYENSLRRTTYVSGNSPIAQIILDILYLFRGLVLIIIGLAVIYFLWGLSRYIISESDTDRQDARNVIVYGIIILFVMVSVWSLVYLLADTIGTNMYIRPSARPVNINNLIN